ncbi:MAG: diguanylate cyclase [Nitrospirae bacterium]|nr:diguanylate cyclase [Nitrospirota bacterium]
MRYSVKAVNENHKFIAGFEEGRIFNGYRFVYPLMKNNEHCGSVEVSFSMGSFLNVLSRLSTNDFAFAIKRSVVEGAVFEHKKHNYAQSAFSPEYMFDKDIYSSSRSDAFLKSISDMLMPHLLKGRDFGFIHKQNSRPYLVLFKTVSNFQGQDVAYLISIGQDKGYEQINRDFIRIVIISAVLFIVIAVLLILFVDERQRLKQLSSTDMLTKVANRRSFIERAETEMARSDRYGLPLSVVLFDIDDFKSLNDRFGHNEGDRVLRNVARVVLRAIRSSDLFGRWGGEEFVFMLPHTDSAAAIAVAEKVCSAIRNAKISLVSEVTASFGVATYKGAETLEDFIDRADSAMYQAKRSGKNCVRLAPMSDSEDSSCGLE